MTKEDKEMCIKTWPDYGKRWTDDEVSKFPSKDLVVTDEVLERLLAELPRRKPSSIRGKLISEGYIFEFQELPPLEVENKNIEQKLDIIINMLTQIYKRDPFRFWSSDEELIVKKGYESGMSDFEITIALREELASDRSSSAVVSRARQLGLTSTKMKRKSKFKTGIDEDDKPIMDRIYDDPPF